MKELLWTSLSWLHFLRGLNYCSFERVWGKISFSKDVFLIFRILSETLQKSRLKKSSVKTAHGGFTHSYSRGEKSFKVGK